MRTNKLTSQKMLLWECKAVLKGNQLKQFLKSIKRNKLFLELFAEVFAVVAK